jgi:hypothetical protein
MAGFKINCSNASTILLVIILVLVVVCILKKPNVETFGWGSGYQDMWKTTWCPSLCKTSTDCDPSGKRKYCRKNCASDCAGFNKYKSCSKAEGNGLCTSMPVWMKQNCPEQCAPAPGSKGNIFYNTYEEKTKELEKFLKKIVDDFPEKEENPQKEFIPGGPSSVGEFIEQAKWIYDNRAVEMKNPTKSMIEDFYDYILIHKNSFKITKSTSNPRWSKIMENNPQKHMFPLDWEKDQDARTIIIKHIPSYYWEAEGTVERWRKAGGLHPGGETWVLELPGRKLADW